MYFIQFREYPTLFRQDETSIRATISIVTHPGSLTYNHNLTLNSSLVSSNDNSTPCMEKSYQWHPGLSSLSIDFDITNIGIIWPARILVWTQDQSTSLLTMPTISNDSISSVFMARSPWLDPSNHPSTTASIERQFILSNERVLRICEDYDRAQVQQIRCVRSWHRSRNQFDSLQVERNCAIIVSE